MKERLLCLDAFRGFDIAAMLLVNMTWNQRVFHPQLFHIDWNAPTQGATFTDLVFPWFLFIAGCAIPLSMNSGRGRSMSAFQKLSAALRRGIVIYLLGVLLTVAGHAYTNPLTWKDLFGWNILQLIGVGYFCAVAVFLLPRKAQFACVAGILLLKLPTLTLIPADFLRSAMSSADLAPRVAGGELIGPGTFTHFDDVKRYLHLEHVKSAMSRDSAGLLPTIGVYIVGWLGMAQQFLPCAAIAVIGGWCTQILTNQTKTKARRAVTLAVFGLVVTGIAYLLQAGYSPQGGGWLGRFTVPFSKWLFSPSYCLLAAGTGAVLLAGIYAVTDAARVTSLMPLRVLGTNALALYVGAEMSFKLVFSKWQIIHPNGHSGAMAGGLISWCEHLASSWGAGPDSAAAFGGWSLVVVWLAGWWLFCWWLWRKNIVIKV